MQYRPLGRSNLKVSALCLGTMTWGEQNTQQEAFAQIDRARDAGVNFIDTAEMYPVPPKGDTYGATETIIGNFFAQRGERDKWILASKIAGPGNGLSYLRGGRTRFTKTHINDAIEGSRSLVSGWWPTLTPPCTPSTHLCVLEMSTSKSAQSNSTRPSACVTSTATLACGACARTAAMNGAQSRRCPLKKLTSET